MASEAGKGSKQRPTNKDAYDEAYDRIWGKKKNKTYKDGANYDTDADIINDVRYDINIPTDHYEE
jgi:hypothetical protein